MTSNRIGHLYIQIVKELFHSIFVVRPVWCIIVVFNLIVYHSKSDYEQSPI